jgi:hypothetical protein
MKRKVVTYSNETGLFVMECGHTSPARVARNINIKRLILRFQSGTLYRDCPVCQRRLNRAMQVAADIAQPLDK